MLLELALGITFLFLLWKSFKKPSNYPPGFWGLPLIGYVPFWRSDPLKILEEQRKIHGDVIIWRLGSKPMVFLYDYDTIRDVLSRHDFVDRPQLQVLGLFNKDGDGNENTGIITSNGAHWHSIRRFSLRLMRDLGMGKSRMVSAVQDEANILVQDLAKRGHEPSPLPHTMNIAVLNVVWQMIASQRFDINDSEMLHFEELIRQFQESIMPIAIGDFFTFLEKVIPGFIWKKIIKDRQVTDTKQKFYLFLKKYVDDHRATLNPDDPRNYIDSYLIEMERQKDNPESNMSEKDLVVCLLDLFAAGSETTATTLKWASVYLANYPETQKKLQKNVDEEMPKGSLPTLEDKMRLSYVEAFIHEIHRHASFVHMGVMHAASQDTHIGKHFIPKGAILHFMVGHVHHSLKYWENPEEFNPDRFLDENGKFKAPQKGFLPFGVGKRVCMGESLARVELLIFLTAFAQQLNFSPPPGKKIDLTPMPESPFFLMPNLHQDIVISPRS